MYSPTESTEPTELLAECIPPQISQIYTEVRLRKIVAEVSGLRSTSLPTFVLFVLFVVVHTTQYHVVRTRITRITRIRLIRLLNIFSHRLHRFTQKLGCLQGGCTSCSGKRQSRVETGALLKLAGSVNSACSVGGTLLRRRPETSATIFRTLTICVDP